MRVSALPTWGQGCRLARSWRRSCCAAVVRAAIPCRATSCPSPVTPPPSGGVPERGGRQGARPGAY
eukprot:6085767-Pyramimonas_sp.AAC.1